MTEPRDRILIVDDESTVVGGLTALLGDDWIVRGAQTGSDALAAFVDFSPDIVLLDVQLPDTSGLDLLQKFKERSELSSVVMMSGVGTFTHVIDSMRLGADTFLQKPFGYETLLATLEQCRTRVATKRELAAFRRDDSRRAHRMLGISPAIKRLNGLLPQISRAASPILIDGESGTGKGVLARLIHSESLQARGPFVDLNCAGLSRELLESELFGHERGAFTGATASKPGLFEIASDGTVFLDEIGELDLAIQGRLLKAVEEKRFRRVGGIGDIQASFRLIASTNGDLSAEVAEGRFRRDLFYRLNVVRLTIPPLRDRTEDIPILADEILAALAMELGMGKSVPTISPRAMKKLAAYGWPGNVRELRNVLERALITLSGTEIRTDDLAMLVSGPLPSTESEPVPRSEWQIQPIDDVVSRYVAAAVAAVDGNIRKAARLLRISPSTLYARLKDTQQP